MLSKKIKLLSIGDYVTYLSRSKEVYFQMSIYRNEIIDVQVFHDNFNDDVEEFRHSKEEIVIAFFVRKGTKKREEVLKKIEDSTFIKNFKKLESNLFGDCYYCKIDIDWDKMFDFLKYILEDIFCYSSDDVYSVELLEIVNNKPILIKETRVSWFEYFFQRT